jgi:hypothetical protein
MARSHISEPGADQRAHVLMLHAVRVPTLTETCPTEALVGEARTDW